MPQVLGHRSRPDLARHTGGLFFIFHMRYSADAAMMPRHFGNQHHDKNCTYRPNPRGYDYLALVKRWGTSSQLMARSI